MSNVRVIPPNRKFCGRCGNPLFPGPDFLPLVCANGHEEWLSPAPVAVVIFPIGTSVLLVKRAIAPKIGDWALPGGYVGWGETIREAGARELYQETGIRIDPSKLRFLSEAAILEATGLNLIFLVADWTKDEPLPALRPDHESSAVEPFPMAELPVNMAFPTHVDAIHKFASNVQ